MTNKIEHNTQFIILLIMSLYCGFRHDIFMVFPYDMKILDMIILSSIMVLVIVKYATNNGYITLRSLNKCKANYPIEYSIVYDSHNYIKQLICEFNNKQYKIPIRAINQEEIADYKTINKFIQEYNSINSLNGYLVNNREFNDTTTANGVFAVMAILFWFLIVCLILN